MVYNIIFTPFTFGNKIFYTFVYPKITIMNQRLQQLLDLESLSQAQFAEMIGVGRASISHILNGRNNPGYEIIQSILRKFPNISPDWLLLGKGKPYREKESDRTPPSPTLFPISLADEGQSKNIVNEDIATENDVFQASQDKAAPANADTCPKRIKRITVYYDDNTFEEFFK